MLPFVGAGVSRSVCDRAGSPRFPTWTELLERAVHRLIEEHKDEAAQAVRVQLAAATPDLIAAAETAREALWGRRWRDFLLEQFNPEIGDIDRRTLALAEAIWSLECPLIVTTNYDRVLEWASPRPADCESWPTHAPAEHARALEGGPSKPIVWHLHGTIQQLDGIILTTSDYKRLYPTPSEREQYTSALLTLRNLLAIKTFVFFGFGFNDESFLSEVLAVTEAFRGNVGPHYAFVHRAEIPRLAGRARELSLELLPFEAFGEPLVTCVRELGQSRTRPMPPATIPPAIPEPEPASEVGIPGMAAVPGLLGDRYRLERRLGHGGFATVWQAFDKRTRTRVAIKILHPHLGHDAQRVARFERGAERMGALHHRNIVRVLAPVVAEGSYRYFVMELLGADLGVRSQEHRLSAPEIVSIVRQLGDALSHAHQRGLIHRDVKPANVLLDAEGVPKLTDFDLVLTRDSSGGTRTGAMGSFLFAAPEVISDPGSADETADVFGLAMTAVYLFHAAPMGAEAYRNATDFIDTQLQCSGAIKAVLARACSWKRERRPATVAEFCEELQAAASAPPERAPSVVVARTPAAAPRPSPPPAAAPHAPASSDGVRAAAPAAKLAAAPGRRVHLGWAALVPVAALAIAVWQLPTFLRTPALDEVSPAPSPESPVVPEEPAPSPAPAPVPTPVPTPSVEDDAEARARAAALQRLRLPPRGSDRGVTRVALGDVSPIRFVELTGGEYTIGSPSSEPSRQINETQHRVRVEP
ncbi:MAG TPA: protein kinase, partial [Nannocystis sp.]